MKNKLIAVTVGIICISLILSFSFTGCKTAVAAETTAVAAETTAVAAETTAAAAETTAGAVDITGKKIAFINSGPDLYYARVSETFVALAESLGLKWDITVSMSEYKPEKELASVQDFITKGVDALVLISTDVVGAAEEIKMAKAAKIPIFFQLGRPRTTPESGEAEGYVGDNWYNLGYAAGSYIGKNYPDIKRAVICEGVYGLGISEPMRDGYYAAIKEFCPNAVAESIGNGKFSREEAIKITEDALASGKPFDAIFSLDEEMGAGILQVFGEQNVTDKIIVFSNGKEESWKWIKEGKINATVPNPPGLTADLGLQQMMAYFSGTPYIKSMEIMHAESETLTKANLDKAIPWIVEDYITRRAKGEFLYKLEDYQKIYDQFKDIMPNNLAEYK
jgi:ABC-type sugar transport system substrate-binding protein